MLKAHDASLWCDIRFREDFAMIGASGDGADYYPTVG